MKTNTHLVFFQPKKPITIRRNQDKMKKSSDRNSTLNFYKVPSTIFDTSDIMAHSIDKKNFAKKQKTTSNLEGIPQIGKIKNRRSPNKYLDNNKKFIFSNMNYFQRNINNHVKKYSNNKISNSLQVDNVKNRYYLKIKNPQKSIHNNYSLPKIKIMKNPMQITLDKEEKKFKDKANSERNILNYGNNKKSKIIYKLKESSFFQNKYSEEISLAEILNENYLNYQRAKHSENSFDKIISYGVNTYRGVIRNYNEDRVTILINAIINKVNGKEKNVLQNMKTSYFSIYDGHAGNKCCEFLKKFLHNYIFESDYFPLNPVKALEEGFNVCEKKFMELIKNDNIQIDHSGSCAIVILILNDICYVANLGDSRALYSSNDGKIFYQISRDHKPNDPIEKNRIYKAGGSIYKPINICKKRNITNGNEGVERKTKIPFRITPGGLAVSYFYHYLGL